MCFCFRGLSLSSLLIKRRSSMLIITSVFPSLDWLQTLDCSGMTIYYKCILFTHGGAVPAQRLSHLVLNTGQSACFKHHPMVTNHTLTLILIICSELQCAAYRCLKGGVKHVHLAFYLLFVISLLMTCWRRSTWQCETECSTAFYTHTQLAANTEHCTEIKIVY